MDYSPSNLFGAVPIIDWRKDLIHQPHSGSATDCKKHTMYPTTTGTSVLGIKFRDGVMLVADTLGSYGSLARYGKVSRMMKLTNGPVLAATGDVADYQYLKQIIEQKDITEELSSDSFKLGARAIFTWLTRVMYQARSRFEPYWNVYVVGGIQDGKPFLGCVDKLGSSYEDDSIATGLGNYLARPVLREALDKDANMSQEQALEALVQAMTVLYYRDCRAFSRYQVAVITKDSTEVSDVMKLESNWQVAHEVKGFL